MLEVSRHIFRNITGRRFIFILFLGALNLAPQNSSNADGIRSVIYTGNGQNLTGYLCYPPGQGPFAAVVFNHGGLGHIVRGSPQATCKIIAALGFIGFCPLRRKTRTMKGHLDDVMQALKFLKKLKLVNRDRVAMIGFSRGGLLTLMAARRDPKIKALVLMASATGRGHLITELSHASRITAPVLILVAENDTGSKRTMGQNLVRASKTINQAIVASGGDATLIIYPPFGPMNHSGVRRSGHMMFFRPGSYWIDVTGFLKKHL